MTVAELHAVLAKTIDDIRADIIAYDEHAAIQADGLGDGKGTTQRAVEALQRPERFPGEWDVARAWLREHSTLSMAQLYLRRRA